MVTAQLPCGSDLGPELELRTLWPPQSKALFQLVGFVHNVFALLMPNNSESDISLADI